MRKIILTMLLLGILIFPLKAEAAEPAESSARLSISPGKNDDRFDERYLLLTAFLKEVDSPLVGQADKFIEVADKYQLDWRLIPAIAGLESAFGKRLVPDSYNPFGWAGGYFRFKSWEEAIETVAFSLRKNYVNRGLTTPELIGPVYAPPNPRWGALVRSLMNRIAS